MTDLDIDKIEAASAAYSRFRREYAANKSHGAAVRLQAARERFRDDVSPDVVLALIAELRAARERSETLMAIAEASVADALVRFSAKATRIIWVDHVTGELCERAEETPLNDVCHANATATAMRMLCIATLRERAEKAERALERVGSALFEPPTLPEGMPSLVERILGAIEQLFQERTAARSGEHEMVTALAEVTRERDEANRRLDALHEACCESIAAEDEDVIDKMLHAHGHGQESGHRDGFAEGWAKAIEAAVAQVLDIMHKGPQRNMVVNAIRSLKPEPTR